MIRPLLILFLLVTCTFSAQAQKIEIIEPAILECEYQKRMVTDTLDRENDYRTTNLKLRIGKQTSMFYAPEDFRWDSLSTNWDLKHQLAHEITEKSNGSQSLWGNEKERIYKNYPTGKIRMYNHFSLMDWVCTEDWEKPEWALLDSVKTVLDYSCQLAVSRYRGRTWYAWFTFDIPISEGPWKLCGLPGLILEAYDEHKDYSFTAIGIRQQNIPPVGIYDYSEYDWATTTRKKYNETWFKYIHEDIGAKMSAAYSSYGLNVKIDKNRKLPHRNYELMETDYHK